MIDTLRWKAKLSRWAQKPTLMSAVVLCGLAPAVYGGVKLSEFDILLYPLPQATYEADLTLTGLADPNQTLIVELDGKTVAKTRSNEHGDFAVVVQPKRGLNKIRMVNPNTTLVSDSAVSAVRYVPTIESAGVELRRTRASAAASPTLTAAVAPGAPLLNTIAPTAASNPISIDGNVEPNATVKIYVNGRYTRSVIATSGGTFSTWAPLDDSTNSIYVTATNSGGETSAASNTVETTYTNTLPRAQTGTIAQTTVWTKGDGTPYSLTGNLTIAPGATLWVQPGTTIAAAANAKMLAQGELVLSGTSTSKVAVKSSNTSCNGTSRRQDWVGIEISTGGKATVEYGEIQCASYGLHFVGGTGSVQRTRFINNYVGLRTISSSGAVISPSITAENEFSNNDYGVVFRENSAATMSGNNLVAGNMYGVYVGGNGSPAQNPTPTIVGNQLLTSNSTAFYTSDFGTNNSVVLNARGNWWGTTNHGLIADDVYDWFDYSYNLPLVDFTGYLNSPNGTAAFTGTTLLRSVDTNQTLPAGETQALGSVSVQPGVVLTMSPGARLRMPANAALRVSGSLVISGTQALNVQLGPTVDACLTTTSYRSDWLGIEVKAGGTATIDYAEVRCASLGVSFNAGTGAIRNSKLLFNDVGVATASTAGARIAPSITTANEVRGNRIGVSIKENSSPTITGGNSILANGYGIMIDGNSNLVEHPAPTINQNTITGNTYSAVYVSASGNNGLYRVDAKNNWWGTPEPKLISDAIRDWTDTESVGVVDYSGFLDAAGGASAFAGPTLNGVLSGTQSLAAVEHLQLGSVAVAVGATVSVQPGTKITIGGKFRFFVLGAFNSIGTIRDRVVFRPKDGSCTDTSTARSDWDGLHYHPGSSGNVDFTDIFCAQNGIWARHSGSIENSRFVGNQYGIYIEGPSATAKTTPLLQSNEIRNSTYGIYVSSFANPTINGGNVLTANQHAIRVYGSSSDASNPTVVFNGNSVYSNTNSNFAAESFSNGAAKIVNARGNWWGTADPTEISATIIDYKQSTSNPHVDFSGYLGSMGGTAAFSGTSLIGVVSANTSAPAGDYEVLGDLLINPGVSMTFSPNSRVYVVPGRTITVKGTLTARGTASQRVRFTSAQVIPAKGDWRGISVLAGGTLNLDQARIEYSTYGLNLDGGGGSVTNSLLRFNTQALTIETNGASSFTSGNEISHNDYGVVVVGGRAYGTNPAPVITGNNIFENSTANYTARNFANETTTTLNATGNWWGSSDPAVIAASIQLGTNAPTVDSSGYLGAATGPLAIYLSGVAVSQQVIDPLIGTSKAQGTFTASRAGTVVLRVKKHSDHSVVFESSQTVPGPGQYTFSWDGRTSAGAIAPPGMYRAVLVGQDGRDDHVVDFRTQSGVAVISGTAPPIYKPYLNESYKAQITLNSPGLISMKVTPQTGAPFYPFRDVYYPVGTHWVYWDGRDPVGTIITEPVAVLVGDSSYVPPNAVQVRSAAPQITGLQAAPNIEVKADPYLVSHSFEQITRMAYRLSADSYVRFVLLPPGVNDIRDRSAVVLLDNQLQPAANGTGSPNNYEVEWRGYDPARPSRIQVSPDGAYTFAIEARSVASNETAVYRGVVNLRQ